MAEKSEGQDTGAETSGVGVDPAAVALALGGASREKADAFLDEQRGLIAIQKHHLHEQIKHLDLGIWEKRLGVMLRLATLTVGIAFAAGLSLMVWEAAHANGLIVDEFTVPPDLAERGLTGQVVAGELLSDLLSLQARSNSVRAASSYANNWGNNLKVEIPETGVSIGELTRFLREWLGHETHVSGAVIRTATGVAVTASAGSDAFPTLTGAEADVDGLVQNMAESIYRRTQPYRHALYLYSYSLRMQEAEAALQTLAANGAPEDRYWAFNGLISLYSTENKWDDAVNAAHGSLALRPGAFVPNFFLARTFMVAQRDEAAVTAAQATLAGTRDPDIGEQSSAAMRVATECIVAKLQGNFLRSLDLCNRARQLPDAVSIHQFSQLLQILNAADLHDAAAYRAALADLRVSQDPQSTGFPAFAAWSELYLGHWSEALIRQASVSDMGEQMHFLGSALPMSVSINPRLILPPVAYALALSGDLKGAHALIDRTPADCNLCLRIRGRVDAREKNWVGAGYWFARAAQDAPSSPFPFTDWGRMLLDKGDADAASAKFTLANKKGPHFADPLDGWGEALMAQNRSDLALAKFAEAEKYAPNWGRLRLKWGEALVYAGKKDEAKKQFALAAGLDLTPGEKAELARHP